MSKRVSEKEQISKNKKKEVDKYIKRGREMARENGGLSVIVLEFLVLAVVSYFLISYYKSDNVTLDVIFTVYLSWVIIHLLTHYRIHFTYPLLGTWFRWYTADTL